MADAVPALGGSRALGETLRELRLNSKLTQRDMAAHMGFPDTIIALVERGERAPTQQYLDSFAVALRLRPRDSAELFRLYRAEPARPYDDTNGAIDMSQCPYRGLFAFRPESTSRTATRRWWSVKLRCSTGIIERDSAGLSQEGSHRNGAGSGDAGQDPGQDPDRGGRPVADGCGRNARGHRAVRAAGPDRGPR